MRASRGSRLQDEIPAVSDAFVLRGRRAQHARARGRRVYAGHTSMIRRDPIGVLARSRRGTSLMMAAWKLAPALAGGNTIVIKPSEQTPRSRR